MFYFCGCLLYLCVELHQCGVHDLTSLPSSTTSSSTSNVEGVFSHVTYLDKVKLLHPPEVVVLSLYEKSFFADTKLGDLTLPLSSVTLNKYVYVSCICIRKWLFAYLYSIAYAIDAAVYLCYIMYYTILMLYTVYINMYICRPFREWIPLASADPANPSSTTWYD